MMHQRKPQVSLQLPIERTLVEIAHAAEVLGMEVVSMSNMRQKAHANDNMQGPPTHRNVTLDVVGENARVMPGG